MPINQHCGCIKLGGGARGWLKFHCRFWRIRCRMDWRRGGCEHNALQSYCFKFAHGYFMHLDIPNVATLRFLIFVASVQGMSNLSSRSSSEIVDNTLVFELRLLLVLLMPVVSVSVAVDRETGWTTSTTTLNAAKYQQYHQTAHCEKSCMSRI